MLYTLPIHIQGKEVDGSPIDEKSSYRIIIPGHMSAAFDRVFSGSRTMESYGNSLSSVWQEAIKEGKKPAEPEDYIELVK